MRGEDRMRTGDRVRLIVPDNPRLNGAPATVESLYEWGARVLCAAAGSGEFRALWSEMQPEAHANGRSRARETGYTGNACTHCGSFKLRRNGACECCEECGASSGCS